MLLQSYIKKKIANAIKINNMAMTQRLCTRSLDVVITTKCSMNCESCANLMQYYKSQKTCNNEILKAVKLISDNMTHLRISNYRWGTINE